MVGDPNTVVTDGINDCLDVHLTQGIAPTAPTPLGPAGACGTPHTAAAPSPSAPGRSRLGKLQHS